MKTRIKINGIPGYYYVEENTLFYSIDDMASLSEDDCIVEDLADLTIYQYNQLAMSINKSYSDYDIKELEGRFI